MAGSGTVVDDPVKGVAEDVAWFADLANAVEPSVVESGGLVDEDVNVKAVVLVPEVAELRPVFTCLGSFKEGVSVADELPRVTDCECLPLLVIGGLGGLSDEVGKDVLDLVVLGVERVVRRRGEGLGVVDPDTCRKLVAVPGSDNV